MPSRINMGPDGGPYIGINENSGNIELEDNTGTTVAVWDDTNSQWDFQNNPISNVDSLTSNSVNTDKIDITSETIIEASRSTAKSSVSSGTRVNLVDSENVDANNEFDESGNAQIVPDDNQRVLINIQAEILNASSGDRIDLRVFDVDAGASVQVGQSKRSVLSRSSGYFNGVFFADLTAGNVHEIQVTDFDSTFDLAARSQFEVIKEVIHQ